MDFFSPVLWVRIVGGLHLALLLGEMLPWNRPFVMGLVLKSKPGTITPNSPQEDLVATIVHNVAIYNGVVGASLIGSTLANITTDPRGLQIVVLTGVVIAGAFGAWSLGKATAIQAILGAFALWLVFKSGN